MSKYFVYLCLAVLGLTGCDRMYRVSGRVLDSNRHPVGNARVEFNTYETNRHEDTITNADGEFKLSYISGWFDQPGEIRVEKTGFHSQKSAYTAGKDSSIEITLQGEN